VDKDLEELIATRCDNVLQKNNDYLALQEQLAGAHSENDIEAFSEISFRMQVIAVRIGYKLGMKDMREVIDE
jgi:hypothetical protein